MSMNWVNKVLSKLEFYTFVNRNLPSINNNCALLSAIVGLQRHKSYFYGRNTVEKRKQIDSNNLK